MTTIETLTADDVESHLLSVAGPVVVDFYQASCPPCRVLEPRIQRVVAQYGNSVPTYRVDIDSDLTVAERFGVRSLPTVLVLQHGREVERLDGLITEDELSATFERLAKHTGGDGAPRGDAS